MDKLNLKSKFDIFAGFAILGIVLMIIIPLPPFALDILLSVNIALSVLILLLTLFSTNIRFKYIINKTYIRTRLRRKCYRIIW